MKSLRQLQPWLRPAAERLVELGAQYGVRITSVRRTASLQRKLYRRYLRGQNPYPVAPPGTSMHEQGRAWDMVAPKAADIVTLGHVWESWGGRWGGRFNDPIHFEA